MPISQLTDSADDLDANHDPIHALKTDNHELRAENKILKAQLKTMNEISLTLNSQITALRSSGARLFQECQVLQFTLAAEREKNDELSKTVTKLQGESSQRNDSRIQRLTTRLKTAREELKEMQVKYYKSLTECSVLKDDLAAQQRIVIELQQSPFSFVESLLANNTSAVSSIFAPGYAGGVNQESATSFSDAFGSATPLSIDSTVSILGPSLDEETTRNNHTRLASEVALTDDQDRKKRNKKFQT